MPEFTNFFLLIPIPSTIRAKYIPISESLKLIEELFTNMSDINNKKIQSRMSKGNDLGIDEDSVLTFPKTTGNYVK